MGVYQRQKNLIFNPGSLHGRLLCFLAFCGTPKNQIVLLLFAAVLAAVICSAVDFWHRKRFFDQVEDTLRELDAPYLISEMMPESWRLEDRLYYHIHENVQ